MKALILRLANPAPSLATNAPALSSAESLRDSLLIGLLTLLTVIIVATTLMYLGAIELSHLTKIAEWKFQDERLRLTMGLLDDIVMTPIVETAFMLIPIRILSRLRVPVSYVPLISGIIWGFLHVIGDPWIALLSAVPFYFLTAQFLREQHSSLNRAWVLVSLSHGVYNGMLTLFQYLVFGPLTNTASWI